jgi:hypothetical protein
MSMGGRNRGAMNNGRTCPNGRADGQDIDYFMQALIYQSTYVRDLCHGDYNHNGVVDPDDMPGFIQALVQP